MTDEAKFIAIANFLFCEGIRVEDSLRVFLSHRMIQYKHSDQLDMLEIIQLMDRLEYFNELSTVINNILFDTYLPRPAFYPLTGAGYYGTI